MKEITFIFNARNLNMNLSDHKFRFEAFQLPLNFSIKPTLIKETLDWIDKIDKDKILHEYKSIKVYSNHQISNKENIIPHEKREPSIRNSNIM